MGQTKTIVLPAIPQWVLPSLLVAFVILFWVRRKHLNYVEPTSTGRRTEIELYKEIYFKLQNLEDHPSVVPRAKDLLLSLFSATLKHASSQSTPGILSIESFGEDKLKNFLEAEQEAVAASYQAYCARRARGAPRELVPDRRAAEKWLHDIAPLKLIDGAWLGHLNRVSSVPFALRPIMKQTWQVLSEELGDGDQRKHHVYIYKQLMEIFKPRLPPPQTRNFLHRYGSSEPGVWRSAVAQLVVSLFSHHFFPEILGFNMHFEALQLDTLKASKELPELGLPADYFLLHISIDNGHSGHAAMSMHSVVRYIQHILETQGETAAQMAWKRVQVGYILSEKVGVVGAETGKGQPECSRDIATTVCCNPDYHVSQVEAIFHAKVRAAHRLHCGSPARISGRSLQDWLDPDAFETPDWRREFLHCLAASKAWVYAGDGSRSRLVREMRWGGKMFGSFTASEVRIIERWIDSLGQWHPDQVYFTFLGQPPKDCFCCNDASALPWVVSDLGQWDLSLPSFPNKTVVPGMLTRHLSSLPICAHKLATLLPLWFTQTSLLESFFYCPARTSDLLGCAIVRTVRAQLGFGSESESCVSGMDERHYEAGDGGIIEYGLEMINRCGLMPQPRNLSDVLGRWPSLFALRMLHLASRPITHAGCLVGMSMAFAEVQQVVANCGSLLSPPSQVRLASLARRQYVHLQAGLEEMQGKQKEDAWNGYRTVMGEIQKCGFWGDK